MKYLGIKDKIFTYYLSTEEGPGLSETKIDLLMSEIFNYLFKS